MIERANAERPVEEIKEYYPCIFKIKDSERVLCWGYGLDNDPNHFLKAADGRLVCYDALASMHADGAFNRSYTLHYGDAASYDFKVFFRLVNQLRHGRVSNTKSASVLLNTFNMFEDLAYTLDLHAEALLKGNPLVDKIFEKLFWGNNLPSVTPEGESYHPFWNKEEAKYMQHMAKQLWSGIVKAASEVFGKTD